VLTLTLNRPEIHNAFGNTLIASLIAVLESANENPDIRAIVITGAGKSFSAGADLNWMRSMLAASTEENERDALQLAAMLRCLNSTQAHHRTGQRFSVGGGVASLPVAISWWQQTLHLGSLQNLGSPQSFPLCFRSIGEPMRGVIF
jgi:1,4-dihydroxy-2-naphthoyl-CoA synthase